MPSLRPALLVASALALLAGASGCGSDPEPFSRADEPKLLALCSDKVDDEDFCTTEVEKLGRVARVNDCTYDDTAEFFGAMLEALSAAPPDADEANRLAERYNEDCTI